jgi:hypothetical protein
MKECPHLEECIQLISRNYKHYCSGKVAQWNQEDCFKFNDLQQETDYGHKRAVHKLPKEWLKEKVQKQ